MKFLNELDSINEEMRQLSLKRNLDRNTAVASTVIAVLLLIILIISICTNRQLKIKNRSIYQRSVEMLEAEKALLVQKSQEMPGKEFSPVEEKVLMPEQSADTKYRASDLTDAEKTEIAARIRFIMDTSTDIYSEGFSLEQFSALVNTRKRYVSQVINETFGKSFPVLLCEYRIKEACRRINDKEVYGKYTIGAIAAGVGFKSQPNFVANFKKIMGMTPSEYQRQANEDK